MIMNNMKDLKGNDRGTRRDVFRKTRQACLEVAVSWLQGAFYMSREDHDRKIWARKQSTDRHREILLVNRTIKHWNKLPAKVLATFLCR